MSQLFNSKSQDSPSASIRFHEADQGRGRCCGWSPTQPRSVVRGFNALFVILLISVSVIFTPSRSTAEPLIVDSGWGHSAKVAFWVQSSLKRVYPKSPPGSAGNYKLLAARNGTFSFQACVQNSETHFLAAKCRVTGPDDLKIQVRRVGYVPLWKVTSETPVSDLEGLEYSPGLVPDPLYPDAKEWIGPFENQSFWITIKVPADAAPGVKPLKVVFDLGKSYAQATQSVTLKAEIEVSPFTIQPRHDFPVTHWWRAQCIWDWYKTEPFDERWWEITRNYIQDLVDHGNDCIYVSMVPISEFPSKRPPQYIVVTEPEPGKYEFDFSRVKRFLDMAKSCGARYYEWGHLWSCMGADHPVMIYKTEHEQLIPLWPTETSPTSDIYKNFLKQFLPQFHDFLAKEKVLDVSYFHVSDEPNGRAQLQHYKQAREILREYAPWMKVMDALADPEYARQGLCDMPIPQPQDATPFMKEKIPHWIYYCLAPLGPWMNRFLDTPLPKLRTEGFVLYKEGARGFLHWGYNMWYFMGSERLLDPFTDSTAGHQVSAGDPFVVYPGKDGPIDSIRWEVFAEALQDYAILQTAGVKPDSALLSEIKSYADFPKSEEWLKETLGKILRQPSESSYR
jgi:hypothetical protein